MDLSKNKLENIFRNAAEQHRYTPSEKVLRQLRFKLWLSDFLSPRPNKLNIFYVAMLAGSIVTASILIKKTKTSAAPHHVRQIIPSENQIKKPVEKKAATVGHLREITAHKTNMKKKLMAVFIVDNTEGCAPLNVKFTNQSEFATSYHWDFGNGKISAKKNPSYIYKKAGNYKVVLTITGNSGTKAIYSNNITVFKKPTAKLSIDVEKSDIASRKVTFINNSTGYTNCSWNFGDSNSFTSEKNVTHSYENYGTYPVTLVAVSKNGCRDTAQLENKFIEKDYRLAFPQIFRPNTTDPGNNGFYSEGAMSSVFYPRNFGAKKYQLEIFTPNGIKVFSTNNILQGWNGYIGDRPAPGGVYDYSAKGIYPNGQHFNIKGQVQVIVEDYYQN